MTATATTSGTTVDVGATIADATIVTRRPAATTAAATMTVTVAVTTAATAVVATAAATMTVAVTTAVTAAAATMTVTVAVTTGSGTAMAAAAAVRVSRGCPVLQCPLPTPATHTHPPFPVRRWPAAMPRLSVRPVHPWRGLSLLARRLR